MLNTLEHIDLIKQFEKLYPDLRLDKEERELWSKSIIYQNGETNKLFLAYRNGYANGKCVERIGLYQ